MGKPHKSAKKRHIEILYDRLKEADAAVVEAQKKVNAIDAEIAKYENKKPRRNNNNTLTLFVDIDGVLMPTHSYGSWVAGEMENIKAFPGVRDTFDDWARQGHRIILTTGRHESTRELTENQLRANGLFWDQLIMNLTNSRRVIFNDQKHDGTPGCLAVSLPRDVGLAEAWKIVDKWCVEEAKIWEPVDED